jgi:hypothetical protein
MACGTGRIAFDELAQLELRLGTLLNEIEALRRKLPPRWCRYDAWYRRRDTHLSLKQRLSQLVGFYAPDAAGILAGSEAYECAYHRLFAALPDCAPGCRCGDGGPLSGEVADYGDDDEEDYGYGV